MTLDEAKKAYYAEVPVIFGGIEYDRISALIYRKDKGQPPRLELELFDKRGHSVTIAPPDRTQLKEAP